MGANAGHASLRPLSRIYGLVRRTDCPLARQRGLNRMLVEQSGVR